MEIDKHCIAGPTLPFPKTELEKLKSSTASGVGAAGGATYVYLTTTTEAPILGEEDLAPISEPINEPINKEDNGSDDKTRRLQYGGDNVHGLAIAHGAVAPQPELNAPSTLRCRAQDGCDDGIALVLATNIAQHASFEHATRVEQTGVDQALYA